MSARLTKKAVIREYVERERPAEVGRGEAAAIRHRVQEALGPGARLSDDYLAGVLDELGVRVSRELRGVSPELYAQLHYGSLEAAEQTLRVLDEHYRKAVEADDREAIRDARHAALLVRRRAELIARNMRVAPEKRAEKEEIARWFAVWLETPDLLFDWLALRQSSPGFRALFP